MNASPTNTAYGDLDKAFRFFNETLFDGKLPPCLITMQRRANSLGYYRARGMHKLGDVARVDEIALNPQHFQRCGLQDVLSTLVHEMCHMWQSHLGARKPAPGYHNAEWSAQMVAIGLTPSHNGKPGGKMTGQNMDHYITRGGAFQKAYARYTERNEVTLYQDALTCVPKGKEAKAEADAAKKTAGAKVASKTKFTCPRCAANVWGAPTRKVCCGDCPGRPFMQPDLSALRYIVP